MVKFLLFVFIFVTPKDVYYSLYVANSTDINLASFYTISRKFNRYKPCVTFNLCIFKLSVANSIDISLASFFMGLILHVSVANLTDISLGSFLYSLYYGSHSTDINLLSL